MTETQRNWERRAEDAKDSLTGVLYRGFSDAANSVLHRWHANVVSKTLLPRLAANSKLLDLGCGYGRLSRVVSDARPDVDIVGQDIALPYCRIFRHDIGACVVADATAPVFAPQSFDAIMAITSLMYVADERLDHVVKELGDLLRPGGVMLALDPSEELLKAIRYFRPSAPPSPTAGSGFFRKQYSELFERNGFRVLASGGNPNMSRWLLMPGLAKTHATWAVKRIQAAGKRDEVSGTYSLAALHRWLLVQRMAIH